MPKLKPETLKARRQQILDAAEACVADAGFHRTTMNDICRRSGLSTGAVYGHFSSKEDLIAGIAERRSVDFAKRLSKAAQKPDFMDALNEIAEHYMVREGQDKNRLFMEIGCESTRNPVVGEIFQSLNQAVLQNITDLLESAVRDGRIAPQIDLDTAARLILLIGDGLCWRRAIEPGFDAREHLPGILAMIAAVIHPRDAKWEAVPEGTAKEVQVGDSVPERTNA